MASYLVSHPDVVADRSVLELGAGTGFLSVLCAKYLGARHVTATDGDERVVQGLDANLKRNGMESGDEVTARTLLWGKDIRETWVEKQHVSRPFDLVLGADLVSMLPRMA